MRLRKPCEHGKYDRHQARNFGKQMVCPGGEFLPEGALVIEKIGGEWPEWAQLSVFRPLANERLNLGFARKMSTIVLDALASQVGESE